MSAQLEKRISSAFLPLGRYGKLANGFRRSASKGQTCAVYFSDNLPGNIVEMGLNPDAIADHLGRGATEVRDWVNAQAALTGRERKHSGQRGKYLGIAFGNERELDFFLQAWAAFSSNVGLGFAPARTSMDLLDATRIAKAATDAGFDISPKIENGWQVFRSSAFPAFFGVAASGRDEYLVGFSSGAWGLAVAGELNVPAQEASPPWVFCAGVVLGYEALHKLLGRAAALAPALTGGTLAKFRQQTKGKPAHTEAERMVLQRIGQGLFRDDLISYWNGRCAVTGLDVIPLLRASHIKPWAACDSDEERLDVYNGLLLAPHLDALFDGGWITFDGVGNILVSRSLGVVQMRALCISSGEKLRSISDRHLVYLDFHRMNVFRD
ncbi:MAG: hypothetical protein H6R01_523 [Burkholderiaceae bacterium]|nr:hypothetical protein [Burkholderiaceae bacterium]